MKQLLTYHFLFGNLRRIWICLFIYAAASAFLLQLVILPYWLPGLHAGNGLWVGGDWVGFHRIAGELSEKIILQGWGAWELRPERQSPAGIAAVFYVFFGPHPWVLIPLNAAVHATTGVLLVCMVQPLVRNTRHALLCALPFVFFPSGLVWYAQIHKDGIFFLGISLCLYGWILMSRLETWTGRYAQVLLPLLYLFGGCFLIWVMRAYGVKLMQGIGFIVAVVLVPRFLVGALQRKLQLSQAFLALLIVVALPPSFGVFKDRAEQGEVTLITDTMLSDVRPAETPNARSEEAQIGSFREKAKNVDEEAQIGSFREKAKNVDEEAQIGSFREKAKNVIVELQWRKTDWLPSFLDNSFLTLSIVRSGYAGSVGGSNIDTDMRFHSAPEFLLYLPRALQIGLAAPFPASWFGQGTLRATTAMRAISAVEMVFVYAALLFLPYALWRWRKQIEVWMMFGFCIILLLIYTYITPNIGSLYRSRHGFLMLLLALGIAGAIALRQRALAVTLSTTLRQAGKS